MTQARPYFYIGQSCIYFHLRGEFPLRQEKELTFFKVRPSVLDSTELNSFKWKHKTWSHRPRCALYLPTDDVPVGGKTHCAMIAAHANDVQNKNETQIGNTTELDIVDTKSNSTDLHNKMELNFESEKLCGV